ncbi:MAG: asparagine synthase (glutamine-hydrolyzing) [Spirochaetales bacterium]|nr:asparagine synthase (glutamine-hydrolyzing) [Spirochaetales bacterium]
MCGFVGLLNLSSRRNNRELEDIVINMAGTIKHRGPDAFGLYHNGPCYLAHQRLSIIDLSESGKQPMTNEDGTVWIAYNGETYNFQDIIRDYRLKEKGHQFRSKTDTEVIIHLYEEIGKEFTQKMNGMYAFALWDVKTRTLILARDPYGIKPLFYMEKGGILWFASELKALVSSPDYSPVPSLEGLFHFLSFDYIPGPHTAFDGIKELRPGHMLIISMENRTPQISRFFDLPYNIDHTMSEKDAIELSYDYLTKAVKRQLIADVPVGVMLSGGIDSSALTALMAEIRGNPDFHTFSLAFQDTSFDESPFAQLVAEKIGTTHHEIMVTPEKVLSLLPQYLTYIDEPYADGSAIPTYILAECAKDFITVLLSGEGGDEVYAGYDTYAAYKIRSLYRRIVPGFLRKGIIHPLVHLLPVSHKKLSLEFKAKRFTEGTELDVPNSHFFWRVVLSDQVKKEVLKEPDRFREFHPSVQFFTDAYQHCGADDELNRLMYLEYSYHLPDDLMIKNDRMSMAHSIEARVPFTDNDLVRFLATVPVKYKMKGLRKKHLLRKGLEGLLPREILDKKKVGLEMPYSRWFRAELRELTEEMVSEKRLEQTGLFNGKKIRSLWDEHMTMKKDHGRFFWGLLNYMLWHDVYIEKQDFAGYHSKVREPRKYNVR